MVVVGVVLVVLICLVFLYLLVSCWFFLEFSSRFLVGILI